MKKEIGNKIFAIWKGQIITRERFFSHVVQLSETLPDKHFGINLCEDRYLFCVSFLAMLCRNQVNLLPHNQTRDTIFSLLADYQDAYCLVDRDESATFSEALFVDGQFSERRIDQIPQFESDQTAAIAFTSGTTDKPKATTKTWGTFLDMAGRALEQLFWTKQQLVVVPTVPAQHMYGLETSLFWPLCSSLIVHHQRPFFPEDIRRVSSELPKKCILVSTPTHLRACVESEVSWRNIEVVLSSTAPLSRELAFKVEERFEAPCLEIFGSTETLSYASRRLTKNGAWSLYPGISISQKDDISFLSTSDDSPSAALDDILDLHSDGKFSVSGRRSDMVKVAGKRSSLSFLNLKLNSINGVEDGVFLMPSSNDETMRLGALVVTNLEEKVLLNELRSVVDEVFLPRPLLIVDKIPRNAVGKISRSKIDTLLYDLQVAQYF